MSAVPEHFRELYRYRVLVESLVRREVKARYRGSILGFFWTLLNPLLLLLVYALVFSVFTRGMDGVPHYPVFLFVGLLPWLWLASSITMGATCISQGGALITRVCMPPQVLPAVVVVSNLVNFALALPVAVGAALAFGVRPQPALLLLPVAVAIELAFVYALTLFVATVTVRFRDVQFLAQNLIMIWFFLTPVVYPLIQVPDAYRPLIVANPATVLIVPFQEILYGRLPPAPLVPPAALALAMGAAWALGALVVAVRVFEAMRDTMAEEV